MVNIFKIIPMPVTVLNQEPYLGIRGLLVTRQALIIGIGKVVDVGIMLATLRYTVQNIPMQDMADISMSIAGSWNNVSTGHFDHKKRFIISMASRTIIE